MKMQIVATSREEGGVYDLKRGWAQREFLERFLEILYTFA